MQSFDKRYNHQCDIQFMIYSFFTCRSMVFTNKSLLCNWESYLVSQLYWLKGPCNRFQTHKRFKRFEVYKSDVLVLLFWKQNMTLSQSDRFPPWGGKQSDWPIRLLSLPGGKTIWLVLCCHMISQKWNSQFSLVAQMIASHDEIPLWKNCINIRAFLIYLFITS